MKILNRSYTTAAAVLLIAILLWSSCKKEKAASPSNPVTGGWRNITDANSTQQSYYLFTSDKKLYSVGYSYDGFKTVSVSTYKVTGNQIYTQGIDDYFTATARLYNMRFSGDTLFFNNGSSDVVILLKDNLAPKTITDWAKGVTVLDKFEDTAQAKTITYHNSKLYTFKYYTTGGAKLVTYKPESRGVSGLATADDYYDGLDYIGNTLWCVGGQYAYIYDPVAGAHTFQSAATTNGNHLWAVAGSNNSLYNYVSGAFYDYNIMDNSWSHEDNIDNDVTDLAYHDGYLYVAKAGLIYKVHPYYHTLIDTWYVEGYTVKGIASDGTNFWITGKRNSSEVWDMIKVSLN